MDIWIGSARKMQLGKAHKKLKNIEERDNKQEIKLSNKNKSEIDEIIKGLRVIKMEKSLRKLGFFGILSLLSYLSMVIFSPLAYPGYNWMSMAVSELSADGSPAKELANRLNSLFGPCAVVSIMAVCVAVSDCKIRVFKTGIYLFAIMEWLCNVGYQCFPWVSGASAANFQNMMHLIITVAVVLLSIVSLIMIAVGAKKICKNLGIWAVVCLAVMFAGAMGTNIMPQSVFGIFERMSTISVVIFNAVLGWYLFRGKLAVDG